MAVDLDKILGLLHQPYINCSVLQQHDVARETFTLPTMVVRDHAQFKYLLTAYVEHHLRTVGAGAPDAATAFGEAKRILDRAFNEDPYQDGYARALQMALDGSHGGMRVLNAIADTLRQRALADYMDHVYYQHINVLSKDDNRALSRGVLRALRPHPAPLRARRRRRHLRVEHQGSTRLPSTRPRTHQRHCKENLISHQTTPMSNPLWATLLEVKQ